MTKLPNKEFQKLVPKLRKKGFYEHKEIKSISWPEYSLAQIEEAKEILNFIKRKVDACRLPSVNNKVGRPLTNPKSLAKAIMMSEFLQLTERQSQGWVELLGPFVKIKEFLDDRVIGEAYNNPEVLYVLEQVFQNTKSSDGKLSGDGTGLEKSRKQNYASTKNIKKCDYLVNIVDSREIVQAFEINENECKSMHSLILGVEGDSLRLDAGFVDRKLTMKIDDKGMIPYIFPKKNLVLNGGLAWKNMYLSLYNDVMKWLEEYHKRSHSESFYSSFKRRNKIILKRRPTARLSQITARIIIHNARKLAYYNKLTKVS